MRTLVLSLVLSGAAAQAWSQDSAVRVTTDKPVYPVSGSDGVKVTVANFASANATIPKAKWRVLQGGKVVFSFTGEFDEVIPPGKTSTFVWGKKTNSGAAVSGSYTIEVGPVTVQAVSVGTPKITVALTPTGKIAGTSRFPLATGNEWVYSVEQYLLASPPPATTESMQVLQAWSAYNLAYVKNFLGADRWVWMTGYSSPVLHVWAAPWGPMEALFRFNRPVGYTYSAPSLFPPGTKMRVGWSNETVTTPAGTFTGCYRLDTVKPDTAPTGVGYQSYWFAPGVGLVQSLSSSYMKNTYRRLLRAKLKGGDGKTYFIGQ